jgi:hypothetical protein
MMRKSEGKPAQEPEFKSAKPGAAQLPNTAGIDKDPGLLQKHQTERFLLINVRKGASKQELLRAIDQAMQSSELPFFRERIYRSKAEARKSADPQPESEVSPPDEALLMFVQQEGW